MVDFDQISEVTVSHMKGGNGSVRVRMIEDGKIKIMRSILPSGSSLGYHEHTDSCEVCYVLEGEVVAKLNGQEELVKAGEVHYCPQGSSHSMENRSGKSATLLCIVTKQ
jgi:quercetin dioxygenase-like cupin family protein